MITDAQYKDFMQRLAEDQRAKNPLILNKFESSFLLSFRNSCSPSQWFTEKRRICTDRMWRLRGPELKFPHPLDTVTEFPRVAAADPAGCEFLVREDGREHRCNAKATHQELRHLRYCNDHAQQVQRACPSIRLVLFKSL